MLQSHSGKTQGTWLGAFLDQRYFMAHGRHALYTNKILLRNKLLISFLSL